MNDPLPVLAGLAAVSAVVVLAGTWTPSRTFVATPAHAPRTPLHRRSTGAARSRRLDAALPDVLDLLVVALEAGLPIGEAVHGLLDTSPVAARPALAELAARLGRGDRVVDALPVLVEHWGTRALALVAAVSTAEVAGLPLAPTLDRIADDARAHRRRAAEADARRLPVRLAVPLVCCTLPSFVCIAIGPLLVGALSSLRAV